MKIFSPLTYDNGANALVPSSSTAQYQVLTSGPASSSDPVWAFVRFTDLINKPTTLSGYAITDAYTIAQVDSLLNTKESTSNKGVANGYAALDSAIKIPIAQIPDAAITDTFSVASQAAMLALTAQKGDIAVRTDINKSFVLKANPATTLANWQELLNPVQSVAGKTGIVALVAADITDSTSFGRALLTAASVAAQKSALLLVKADVGLDLVENVAVTPLLAAKLNKDGDTATNLTVPDLLYLAHTGSVVSRSSANGNARAASHLVAYRSAASVTGAIVLSAPTAGSDIQHQMSIRGYTYSPAMPIDFIVQGYHATATGAWSLTSLSQSGILQPMVRWGIDPAGKACLILGDVDTVWSQPYIFAETALFGGNISNSYTTGWTSTLTTDLSAYTQITSSLTDQGTGPLVIGTASIRSFSATDLNGTLGSANSNIALGIEGLANAHVVVGIQGNDSTDGFFVIDKTNGGPSAAYNRQLFAATPSQFKYMTNDIWHAGNFVPASKQDILTSAGIIELSADLTGSRNSGIDFHSSDDASQSNYSGRILRQPGVNGNFLIASLGSGNINISPGTGLLQRDGNTIHDDGNYPISQTGTASTLVQRNASGHVAASYFRSTLFTAAQLPAGRTLEAFPGIEFNSGTNTEILKTVDAATYRDQLSVYAKASTYTQTQVNDALALKADLASPALTGTPTSPTVAAGTNTTQIATTAFVFAGLALKANLASPALTGTPTAPTATAGTNTTQIATTAFVNAGDALQVSKTGDIMTGLLDIRVTGSTTVLKIGSSTTGPLIAFYANGDYSTRYGYIQANSNEIILHTDTGPGGPGYLSIGRDKTITTNSVYSNPTLANATLNGTTTVSDTVNLDTAGVIIGRPANTTLARTANRLSSYRGGQTATGAIVFSAPAGTGSIMHQLSVRGFTYTPGMPIDFIVQGYRVSSDWVNTALQQNGLLRPTVRWAVDAAGKNCLIVGDVGTVWSYPHLEIFHSMFGHTNVSNTYLSGWTSALVTDLTNYTYLSAAIADTGVYSSLDLKANLASPVLTGTPTAPTGTTGDNTTQIATNAFVFTGLALKANLASPALTGTPTAPTAAAGTNTTQIATTAFVAAGLALKADLASPTFTGTPAAPTAAAGTSTTQIATTAFTTAAIAALVYTGTSATNVAFPVGTTLLVRSTTAYALAATVTVRLSTTTGEFADSGTGTTLTGTWRSRGQLTSAATLFVQRTA